MTVNELGVVMRGIAPVIEEHAAKVFYGYGQRQDALSARLKALEDRPAPLTGDKGDKGDQGDVGLRGPEGPAGNDVDQTVIEALKAQIGTLQESIAVLESKLAVSLTTKQEPPDVDAMVKAAVTEAIAQVPPGERGEPGLPGEKGDPGEPGTKGERGPEGPAGREGRDGLSVHGPPGEKGTDGRNGLNGKDGIDALGFDDIAVEHDGERGFTFKFVRGEQVKLFGPFTVPLMIHRGVYQSGKAYDYQDVATFGGSQWVCMQPTTTAKPGDPNSGWLLVVKHGRDGKDKP